MTTVGLLNPGEMGSMVGAAVRSSGARVLWAGDGRSAATRKRASEAGLEDSGSVAAVARAADVILSVCPPHAAVDLAKEVAALRFAGTFVDGNAVSPATAREIGGIVEKAGAAFVDGGIIGPPPVKPGSTRFYVSGAGAERIARLLTAGPLEAIVVPGGPGAASAVKMAYASWTKGSSALLLAVCAMAAAEGVEASLVREWKISQPDLSARAEGASKGNTKKAWRFIGEMEEIAATYAAVGLPDGFHQAAAEIYRRMSIYKDGPTPSLAEVLRALTPRRPA
jgi:3-hydroxyisobutyrate dehydrogenase-like beta-hydroxyacid dehydrogenase